jgi:hypothetical protein
MFRCRVVADSFYSTRITTLELTYPRFIHSEIMTHRDRARNAGSSRAIPSSKMLNEIISNPVVPIYWGANQKGMQTGDQIGLTERIKAEQIWIEARDACIKAAEALNKLNIHKSLVNRITEPWMWITVVMTATTWKNFFDQRCHPDAEIHFQKIAGMMKDEIEKSKPLNCLWHLPYIEKDDIAELETLKLASVARCARVSYVQHGEKAKSLEKDVGLARDLIKGSGELGHRSPFEHVAMGRSAHYRSGPFQGWHQLRKDYWHE